MLYELATLDFRVGATVDVAAGVDAYIKDPVSKGQLLGLWSSDVGTLNQMFVLRQFENASDLHVERLRAMNAANPFHCGSHINTFSVESYAPFPYLPPVVTGAYGGVYEIRQYTLQHGGLQPTIALWETWLPGRLSMSPLTIAMYALDGSPRYAHIWPYADAGARARMRGDAVAKGVWPPKGVASWIATMRSTLAIPTAQSPLR
jgi:NIPSNAP